MRFKYIFLLIGMIMIILSTKIAAEKAEGASEKMNTAFRSCEKGLKMNMPKSRGSLKILQSHFNSYQRNRDAALQIDDTLNTSKSEYYEGTLFTKKTFAEVYDICEKTFAQKVAEASAQVSEKVQEIEAKQKQQQINLEKNTESKQHVGFAINKYCANFSLRPQQQESNASLYNSYQAAKQKAIEIYPDIIKEYYTATFKNSTSGMVSRFNKSVKEWFEYCDKVFVGQAKKLEPVVRPEEGEIKKNEHNTTEKKDEHQQESPEEGPALKPEETQNVETGATSKPSNKEETVKSFPPSDIPQKPKKTDQSPTSSGTPPKEEVPQVKEEIKNETTEISSEDDNKITDEDKTEYEGVVAHTKGDRLKILKEEGRLPDFVNDEDYNYQKASIWQFEKDSGNKCSIYTFRGDQLAKAQKDFRGECPSF